MISADEYKRRVEENKKIYLEQVLSKSFDFTKFHGFDALSGEIPVIKLLKKVHDIYTAVNLNMLPYLNEHTGADAVRYDNIEFIDVELKSCYVHVSATTAFKTKSSTIYTTKDVSMWNDVIPQSKVALLTSAFKASFDKRDTNRHTKNRDTYLLLIDGNTSAIIDCFLLTGDHVVNFLQTSNDIKLGSFMKYGKSVKSELNNSIGWDTWVDQILPTLETKQLITKKQLLSYLTT